MNPQAPTPQDPKTRLMGRAATDPAFRHTLLTDPRRAIEQELGVTLPADLEIQVVEETPTRLCLVLPALALAPGELTDQDLANVAGGLTMATLPGPLPMPVGAIPEPIPTPAYSFDRLAVYYSSWFKVS